MIYNVIGLMSGTSLDGLDVSLTTYSQKDCWAYNVVKAKTYNYTEEIIKLLQSMKDMTIGQYLQANIEYSQYVVQMLQDFLKDMQTEVHLISLHGHTIFHQPSIGVSLQCCDPLYLCSKLNIDCVGNFRQMDVYRGGQGAPLVPFGSELFPKFECFLNFGGIVNIDYRGVGWDIGYCNMLSNFYSEKLNKKYDENGDIGRMGCIDSAVLEVMREDYKLNKLSKIKSFARQDFEIFVKKIPTDSKIQDILHTHYQYISELIVKNIEQLIIPQQQLQVLCTGGGSHNKYLIEILENKTKKIKFVVADKQTVDFKEAIVFGFIGLKMVMGLKNCSSGVGGQYCQATSRTFINR